MLDFVRRNRVVLTCMALLAISLLLLSASARSPRRGNPAARFVLDALGPVQGAATWARSAVSEAWNGYVNLAGTKRENRRLRSRLAALRRDLDRLAEIARANERYRELLAFREHAPGHVVAARVIGRGNAPWFRSLIVDRGTRDGVRPGLAVVSAEGVVGQIAAVGRSAARVVLLTDHRSGIDALLQRSRARGIVRGDLAGGCSMEYLSHDADVRAGDRVVTSGLDGVFPKGSVVGRVTSVRPREQGLLQTAGLQPAVPLDRLEEVLIMDVASKAVDLTGP